MKEISAKELKQKFDAKDDFQLIDVREPDEFEAANLGGELIPMGEVTSNLDKISKDKMVVVHCRSGKRSAAIVNALEGMGYTNLYNLSGGILAYMEEFDLPESN